jgi:hypothetical protein
MHVEIPSHLQALQSGAPARASANARSAARLCRPRLEKHPGEWRWSLRPALVIDHLLQSRSDIPSHRYPPVCLRQHIYIYEREDAHGAGDHLLSHALEEDRRHGTQFRRHPFGIPILPIHTSKAKQHKQLTEIKSSYLSKTWIQHHTQCHPTNPTPRARSPVRGVSSPCP